MWLLKLHFSISVLCLLAALGIRKVYADTIKENGYVGDGKKKSFSYWLFFVPVMNVLFVIVLLIVSGMKKEDFKEKLGEMRKSGVDNGR